MNSTSMRFLPDGHPACEHGIPFDSECCECQDCAKTLNQKAKKRSKNDN